MACEVGWSPIFNELLQVDVELVFPADYLHLPVLSSVCLTSPLGIQLFISSSLTNIYFGKTESCFGFLTVLLSMRLFTVAYCLHFDRTVELTTSCCCHSSADKILLIANRCTIGLCVLLQQFQWPWLFKGHWLTAEIVMISSQLILWNIHPRMQQPSHTLVAMFYSP